MTPAAFNADRVALLADELQALARRAERADKLAAELEAERRERERWQALAEALGKHGQYEFDTKRRHLHIEVRLDEELLALAKDRKSLIYTHCGEIAQQLLAHCTKHFQ